MVNRAVTVGMVVGLLSTLSSSVGQPLYHQITGRQFADRQAQCAEFSDRCQICLRGQDGRISCSMPGIACQPQAWRCTELERARQ